MNKTIKILSLSISFFGSTLLFSQATDTGTASYYNNKFQGKKTASGEKYKKNKLTAAHRTLPFNTQVKVTNLSNNKSVLVIINDRGPYKKGRIIDVSEAAAIQLDLIDQGVATVEIEVLD